MAQREFKKVVFCQGGKKELEEITGEEYEYIKPEEISAAFPEAKPTDYSKNTLRTFIETYVRYSDFRKIKRELYKKALEIDADALIHYTEQFAREEGSLYAFAKGTPVRKKN